MKHTLLILIFLPFVVNSQHYLLDFDKYNSDYVYEWRGFDKYDIELINAFTNFCEKNNILVGSRSILENSNNNFRNHIATVDLNNDNILDIIYNGPSGGEPHIVTIFINETTTFKQVFSDMQGVVKVDWKDELIDKLYLHDWGCCADPELINKVYQVTYNNKIPTFNLIWQSLELNRYIEKPKSYFNNPIRFKIDNDLYKIRYSPVIDDKTEDLYLKLKGNYLGKLKIGTTGTAYASKLDSTGRVWWYVVIDREFNIIDNVLSSNTKEFPTNIVGWISSRYVSRLE